MVQGFRPPASRHRETFSEGPLSRIAQLDQRTVLPVKMSAFGRSGQKEVRVCSHADLRLDGSHRAVNILAPGCTDYTQMSQMSIKTI